MDNLELQKIADKIKKNIFFNESECVQDIILIQDNIYFESFMSSWIREYIRKKIYNNQYLIPEVKCPENKIDRIWKIDYKYTEDIKKITDNSIKFINKWFEINNINIKVG
jgi:hypothetical protein